VWRVTINRVNPQDNRSATLQVSNGDTITIPGGGGKESCGAWYETDTNTDPTFSYTRQSYDNLLPDDTWIDFTSANYFATTADTDIVGGKSDPDGGSDAYEVQVPYPNGFEVWSEPVLLEPNTEYTWSVWAKGGDFAIYAGDNGTQENNRLSRLVYGQDSNIDQSKWHRIELPLRTDSTGYIRVKIKTSSSNGFLYQPMINRHEWAASFQLPSA